MEIIIYLLIVCVIFKLTISFFGYIKSVAETYPLETARFVIGYLVSLIIASKFNFPYGYDFVISCSGGSFCAILGELL